jgi:hypothetical protein
MPRRLAAPRRRRPASYSAIPIRFLRKLLLRRRNSLSQLHDTDRAKALLLHFEEIQALHVADRDRLRRELSVLPRAL